jgi:2-desacetyl-2-hydroxyethyl bacteriochlorophyllide A dehydrogenase
MVKTAKAVVMVGPGEVRLEEVPLPEVTDESIVVKTRCSGISTGTEMRLYDGHAKAIGLSYPLIPGNEEVGEVVEVGNKVIGFRIGDRVMANEVYRGYSGYSAAWGGQVEYAVIGPHTQGMPAYQWAVPIPDGVSYEEAVVAYLASVSYKGVERIPVKDGATALVIGQGVVGLSAAQLLKLKGARVIVADLYEARLRISRPLVDHTIDASTEDVRQRVREITGGKMADIVFEASGNAKVAGQTIELSAGNARIHYQAAYTEPVVFPHFIEFSHSDRVMTGSTACAREHKAAVLNLIREGRFDARSLITEIRPISDAVQAYADAGRAKDRILKVVFRWD